MPARTGKEVIDRLQSRPPNLWLDGQFVEDPTQHPKTRNAVRSLAALYDLQYRDDLVDTMTVKSPSSGDRVGRSFVVPETKDDLRQRSQMHDVLRCGCSYTASIILYHGRNYDGRHV